MPRAELDAWRRWQRAAGPWVGWAVCPSLMFGAAEIARAPDGSPLPDVRPLLDRDGTAMVVDLDPLLGVALAAAASRTAHVVLVLPRWPHADAVLACEALT